MFGRKLKWKQLKGCNDFYLKCDVLLLGAVIEKVRSSSLKNYELCPSHYFKAPGLSWDAMLKITKNKLELIPDLDMYMFFEKSTRSGIYYIFNRYSKSKNKYLRSYDPKQESKHII